MTTDEALRRIRLITPMLREDVRRAIFSHAPMEAMNDVVSKALAGQQFPFADAYNATQNALALKVALDLARIFDVSKSDRFPPHTQDKASVPVLAALLGVDGVRQCLSDLAYGSFAGAANIGTIGSAEPGLVESILKDLDEQHRLKDRADCEKAIDDFLAVAGRVDVAGSAEMAALDSLREFRNKRLAHSLFDKEPDAVPKHKDLDLLLGVAKDAARLASLACDGLEPGFDENASFHRKDGERYAACVLDGLKRALEP